MPPLAQIRDVLAGGHGQVLYRDSRRERWSLERVKELMAGGEFWVASRCRFPLATVPPMLRDPRIPADSDSAANDHLCDATSHLIIGSMGGTVSSAPFDVPDALP